MKIQDQVINYVVDKIRREFPENIALLLCYGSYINGTANEKSDVDMYFIPRDEKGFELSETFILKGIGYDIFGMSWDRAEAIASFQESLSPLVGDAKIIYSHSDDEVNRFRQLQQHMKERLADVKYMYSHGCDKLRLAASIYETILSEPSLGKVRLGAGYILMFLAEAVAYGNQTYFHKGLKTQYEDLKQLKDQPAEFTRLYHDVIIENDIHQIKDKCKQIIKSTIDFLGLNSEIVLPQTVQASCAEEKAQADETAAVNYANAAGWYEELSSTFNKIYICAENKNYMLAFLSACCLQYSLKSDLEIPLKTKDLLSEFQYDDLERLASKAREIEWNCISEIEKNHVTIKRVESVEILLQYKSQANKHI